MIQLKYYRDGGCVRTERFENRNIAHRFKKAYEKSYTAYQKSQNKIYCILKQLNN